MESTDSSTGGGSQHPNLPPGFRFHPTDEELIVHYLKKKAASAPLPIAIIAEVDLYKFDPWELPAKATFGEQEWYFFTPRDRKYPNGARPNRAATSGYWKATGTDKPVLTSEGTQKVGVKKALVFYGGKPPKGMKTNWIMHEYRLVDNKFNNRHPSYVLGNKKNSLRLDDWVLCRIYKKNNSQRLTDHDEHGSMEDMLGPILPSMSDTSHNQIARLQLGLGGSFGSMIPSEQNLFEGVINNHGGVHSTNTMSQFVSPDSKSDHVSLFSFKRGLSSLYWPNKDPSMSSPSSKGFDGGGGDDDGNGSMATILCQLTQTPSHGDGVYVRPPFQFHGLNWYT